MTITTPNRPEVLPFLGCRARILCEGDLGLVDMMDMPAGDMPPLHVHAGQNEGFYVLAGELTLFLPGREALLRAGDFLLAPAGVPHTYRVGDEPARALVISSPGGFEAFVRAVAALPEVDPGVLAITATEHGIDILGPPGALPS